MSIESYLNRFDYIRGNSVLFDRAVLYTEISGSIAMVSFIVSNTALPIFKIIGLPFIGSMIWFTSLISGIFFLALTILVGSLIVISALNQMQK